MTTWLQMNNKKLWTHAYMMIHIAKQEHGIIILYISETNYTATTVWGIFPVFFNLLRFLWGQWTLSCRSELSSFSQCSWVKFDRPTKNNATNMRHSHWGYGTPLPNGRTVNGLKMGGYCTIYLLPGMILQEAGCFSDFPKNKQVCWKNDSQNKSQLAISFARSKWGHFQGEMARYGRHRHRATKVPRLEFLWEMQRERFDTLRVERKSEKEIEQHPI